MKRKYIINEDKEARRKILFKMFCYNCMTTIDNLKEKYIKIPSIIKKENEDIFNVNNYVFVVKKVNYTNSSKIKINENYTFKLQKKRWIKTYKEKAFNQLIKELNKYSFIFRFQYNYLFDIIYRNKLFNRYTLFLRDDEKVFIYDFKLNKLTYTKDIENYKEFLGAKYD